MRLRIFIPVIAGLVAVMPTSSGCIENVYSRGVYPMVQYCLTSLSNLTKFSLFDLFVGCLAFFLVSWWSLRIKKASVGSRGHAAWLMTGNTVLVVGVVYLFFMLCWGLNYRRESLKANLDFDAERVTHAALVDLTKEAVEQLNELHAPAHATSWPDLVEMDSILEMPFTQVQRKLALRQAVVLGRPKSSVLGWYFRQAAIDGMIDPFFLEILINQEVLPFERPYVVAHEWAHLAGYADEAEASFVGWLICQTGGVATQYSGWLQLFAQLLGHLPVEQRVSLTGSLGAGPRRDLQAISTRVNQATPFIRRRSARIYDRFLKANRVSEGIASYGGVVDLVLGIEFGS